MRTIQIPAAPVGSFVSYENGRYLWRYPKRTAREKVGLSGTCCTLCTKLQSKAGSAKLEVDPPGLIPVDVSLHNRIISRDAADDEMIDMTR
jgi:hypothetical protein